MFALFFIFSVCSSPALANYAEKDTIPPSFSWISPAPYSVITENIIRLAVDARDNPGGSGIEKVTFAVRYIESTDQLHSRHIIGEVNEPPYEIFWDCSHIPDQNLGKLRFFCIVTDNAGNSTEVDDSGRLEYNEFVLDRNPDFSPLTLSSRRTRSKIVLDGDFSEWAPEDSLTFRNNGNVVTAYSMWDKKNLYFAIRVKDSSVISLSTPENSDIYKPWFYDDIEIFLDVNHNRSFFMDQTTRHINISPAGTIGESIYNPDANHSGPLKNLEVGINVKGTLNDEEYEDYGYLIEIAIPWKELGIRPGNGKTLGLEIWNHDKDTLEGSLLGSGWTTHAGNLKNPSEWGTLLLVDEHAYAGYMVIILLASFLSPIGYILYNERKKRLLAEAQEKESQPLEKKYIRDAREYTSQHFSDDNLNRSIIAAHVGLNSTYFGQVFKEEAGVSYSEYLTNIRIEKAKELLLNTTKNVSEIAYETGFSSQSYFCTVFKGKTGLSPKQFLNQKQ